MKITLNIGLAISGQPLEHSPAAVLSLLAKCGFRVLTHRLAQSTTGPTLVTEVLPPEDWHNRLYFFSCVTRQFCVAVRHSYGRVLLIGPNAARNWSTFDPDLFLPLVD